MRRRRGVLVLAAAALVVAAIVFGTRSNEPLRRAEKPFARRVALVTFVVAAAGLVFAERALRRRREAEEVDAAVREAFEELEKQDRTGSGV